MPIYLAFLRAVNLPGHKPAAMADLRDLLTQLGFSDPRSLLQSGNLVFRGKERSTAGLERLLETEAAQRLGLETDFFVRTAEEWREIVDRNPFPKEAEGDPGHLVVVLLKETPSLEQVNGLQAAIKGREVVRGVGRQAYIVYPDGIGRSRLTSAIIEKRLSTRGTGRNWNTVLRLATLTTE
jgi:uncharacterized protein (DUF1697 family)